MPQHRALRHNAVGTGTVMVCLCLFGVSFFYSIIITRKRRRETLDEIGRRYLTTNKTRPSDSKYVGGDKIGKGFTVDYETILAPFQAKSNVRFMEIGVWYGKSLAMWADWFQSATIYGVDIHLQRFYEHKPELDSIGAFRRNTVEVHEFDTSSTRFESWIREQKPMDIVLDDGDHRAKSQWQLFAMIFPLLAPGGIYIIEDIQEPLELFTGDDVMSGFTTLLAALTDPDYLNSKLVRKRWIEAWKQKARQRYIETEKAVKTLQVLLGRAPDDNERDRLGKVLQQKESELASMIPSGIRQKEKQELWEIFEKRTLIYQGLAKHLLRVEVRQQNVVFYKVTGGSCADQGPGWYKVDRR